MEKFTSSLVNNNNAVTKDATEQVSAQMSKQLEQEKLKFESELQSLKTSLHREVEQERSLLKQDREAFERMVVILYKEMLTHVFSIEPKPRNRCVCNQSTRWRFRG